MHTPLRILLVLWLCLCAVSAQAHTIGGKVYGGSAPLPGAVVTVIDAASAQAVAEGVSDAGGGYALTVADGSYDLVVSPPASSGYASAPVHGIVVRGASVQQDVVLLAGARRYAGVVRGLGGVALPGARVTIKDTTGATTIATATPRVDGSFSFALTEGAYRVEVSANRSSAGAPWPSGAPTTLNHFTPLTVPANDLLQDIQIPFVELKGRTTDANGVAVANVSLTTSNTAYTSRTGGGLENYWNLTHAADSVRSDASGHYAMWLLPRYATGTGQPYTITAAPPADSGLANTPVAGVSPTSEPVQTRDFVLLTQRTYAGVVRGLGGVALPGARVTIKDAAGATTIATATPRVDGSFSFALTEGAYRVEVSANRSSAGAPWPSGAPTTLNHFTPLTVPANDLLQDIQIPFVELKGRTTDANGVAVANVSLTTSNTAYTSRTGGGLENYWNLTHAADSVRSDASGHYAMWLLPRYATGTGQPYTITAAPPADSGLANTPVAGVSPTSEPVQTRDFVLLTQRTYAGVVRGLGGVALPGARVTIKDAAGATTIATATPRVDGSFSFALTEGAYRVEVSANRSSAGAPWPSGAPTTLNHFTPLTVPANDLLQDIQIPFVELKGRTTDANGVAVANVSLTTSNTAYTSRTGGGLENYWNLTHAADSVRSDASGHYAMWLLPRYATGTGTPYTVTVAPPVGSGFATTPVADLTVSGSRLLNVILAYPDTVPPKIVSGPSVRSIHAASAVVEWQTDEPTRGTVSVGGASVSSGDLKTLHSVLVTGLSASSPYTAAVGSVDAAGNAGVGRSVGFTTAAAPDTTAPVVLEGPTVSARTHHSLVVEWTTSEPAQGVVSYGATGLGSSVAETAFQVQHRVEITGLAPDTEHQVQVTASDAAGNGPTLSRVVASRTLPTPDTAAPVITNGPLVTDITEAGATVRWRTDEPASSGVSWHDGTAHGVLTDATPKTEHRVQVTGLRAGTAYQLTVSSSDAAGNGPTLSPTVAFTTQAAPDTTAPALLGAPTIVNVTHQSAVIRWDVDEPADGQIVFGILALDQTESRSALSTRHNVPLVGLQPGTTYQFQVRSTDASGNTFQSAAVYTFTTKDQPGQSAPAFEVAPAVGYASDKAAVVQWKTDKLADSQVTLTAVDEPPRIAGSGKPTDAHEVSMTGLTPNKAYTLTVKSTDGEGRTVTRTVGSFTTPPAPDSQPPVLSSTPAAQSIGSTRATIAWTTDKLANSVVKYGLAGGALNQIAGDIGYTRQHGVVLSKLRPNADYQFVVTATDPSGNAVHSGVLAFSTGNRPDSTPPTLGTPKVTAISGSGATIEWTTDEPASSTVHYGTTSLNRQLAGDDLVLAHSVRLSGLSPNTRHVFRISVSDASGNTASSASLSFETTAAATLTGLSVTGPAGVDAGAAAGFAATAVYSDHSAAGVVPVWDVSGSAASIGADGRLVVAPTAAAQTVTVTATHLGLTAQKTVEIRPQATSGSAAVTFAPSLPAGWTLAGNGLGTAIDVAATFSAPGVADKVITVWTWDAEHNLWRFYSPALDAAQLAAYAESKGYAVLGSIAPRQGYWVNAAQPVTLAPLSGVAVAPVAADLVAGWNLMSTGVETTPGDWSRSIGGAPDGIVSLWTWDNPSASWFFYAPSLDAQGGSVLKDYADSKGYVDFRTHGRTLRLGAGFWVNR